MVSTPRWSALALPPSRALVVVACSLQLACVRAGFERQSRAVAPDRSAAGVDVGSGGRGRDASARDRGARLDPSSPPSERDAGSRDALAEEAPCPGGPTVFYTNMPARRVLGQADFVGSAANRGGSATAASLSRPLGVVVYGSKLLVADNRNNRLLVFDREPASDGAAATAVIGQPDFTSTAAMTSASTVSAPQGLGLTGSALFVAEWDSARASLWPLDSLFSTPRLSTVFGQVDANSAVDVTTSVTPTSLGSVPSVLAVGSHYLVTDSDNHRVLVFDSTVGAPPAAIAAIGQPDLQSNGAGSLANQLNVPLGLATDGVRLAVVDAFNDRLLFFDQVPTTSGVAASSSWGSWGQGALNLDNPVGALSDGTRLFVADRGNDRVLVFNRWPTSPDQPPDVLIGQATYGTGEANQGQGTVAAANSLWGVHFLFYDGCRLFLSDTNNNRVLIY
ncbi:MAG: hypothetical protein IPG96_13500 [Proteobacteria bacterium]|nr:hypothetical protein [Pseudomonadota bacterium]